MRVEHELGGIPFARPSLEVVEQKAPPAPTAGLGAQIQVLHLIADAVLAVRDAPDSAAAHGPALVVRQHDEDPGGLREDVGRWEDGRVSLPGKALGAHREVLCEKFARDRIIDRQRAQLDHASSLDATVPTSARV
jgi:hypothetical protein